MTFLDKKERVLDIELTQYGKYLLSKGRLNPVYYSFFDDDIIYDSQYAGFSENQKDTQDRILEQARPQVQYVYDGLETNIRKLQEVKRNDSDELGEKIQKTPEKHYALSAPIGNSSLASENMPAWRLDVLNGEISGTVDYKIGDHQTLRIPQINIDSITFETMIKQTFETPNEKTDLTERESRIPDNLIDDAQSDITLGAGVFQDGTYIDVKEDYLLLQISEDNTPVSKENFEIEVYMIEDDFVKTGKEVLVPLNFVKKKPRIVNDILLDEEPEEDSNITDPTYVEYFFYTFIDDEINQDILCKAGPSFDKSYSRIKTLENFECPRPIPPRDIYETDVIDIEEDCLEIDFEI